MSKHTPGPWEAVRVYEFIDNPAMRITASGGNVFVADASYSDRGIGLPFLSDADEMRANARLIAAAPDLLEAAKLVIAWFEAEDDHSKADFYQRIEMYRESEAAIRAAIAKAEAQQ